MAPRVLDGAFLLIGTRRVLEGFKPVEKFSCNDLSRQPLGGKACRHVEGIDDHRTRGPGIPEERPHDGDDDDSPYREREIEGNEKVVADVLSVEVLALHRSELDLLLD